MANDCQALQGFRRAARKIGTEEQTTAEDRAAVKTYFEHAEGSCPTCKAHNDEVMRDYDDEAFSLFLSDLFQGPPEGTRGDGSL